MIQLATLEDMPRSPERRKLRRYRDEMRRALWIGGGSISIPGDPISKPGFDGNFGALVPGLIQYLRSDLGLTLAGSLITAWANQGGSAGSNGTVIEATAGKGLGSIGPALNGFPTVDANGVDQYGKYPYAALAPASSPTFRYTVFRSNSSGSRIYMDSDINFSVTTYRELATNQIHMFAGAASQAANAQQDTWGRAYWLFTGSANDTLKWGNLPAVSGAGTGNVPGIPPRSIFAFPNGVGISAQQWALHLQGNGVTPANLASVVAALDAAVDSFYAGLITL